MLLQGAALLPCGGCVVGCGGWHRWSGKLLHRPTWLYLTGYRHCILEHLPQRPCQRRWFSSAFVVEMLRNLSCSFLHPFPQQPAPLRLRGLDIHPWVALLNHLERHASRHAPEALRTGIGLRKQPKGIVLGLKVDDGAWSGALLYWPHDRGTLARL